MAQYSIYVYAASDFTTGLPNEAGGQAAGSPPFILTLAPGAQPIEIVIEDNDGDFGEEIGTVTQSLVDPVTINGVTYPAGSNIVTAYDLINSGTAHQVTSFHIGGGITGFAAGPVQGIVTTQPMTPGSSYVFNQERTSYNQDNPYDQFVCFARGTHILTDRGEKRVETLALGDQVRTRDNGLQAIRWIGARIVPARGRHAPVVIKAGALGASFGATAGAPVPHRDLVVSPQHRILLTNWRCEMFIGGPEALIPAKHLCRGDRVFVARRPVVEYFHLLFDRHEVILAEGVEAESFHPNKEGMNAMQMQACAEIFEIFPELAQGTTAYGPTVYPALREYEAIAILAEIPP